MSAANAEITKGCAAMLRAAEGGKPHNYILAIYNRLTGAARGSNSRKAELERGWDAAIAIVEAAPTPVASSTPHAAAQTAYAHAMSAGKCRERGCQHPAVNGGYCTQCAFDEFD